MSRLPLPFKFALLMFASWVNRQQLPLREADAGIQKLEFQMDLQKFQVRRSEWRAENKRAAALTSLAAGLAARTP